MTKLVRHLIEDARRGSLAALLVLAGLCAGLSSASGASPAGRETLSRLGAVRPAAAGTSLRSSQRADAAEIAPADVDGFFAPPPPRIVLEKAAWAEPAPYDAAPAAVLPGIPGDYYRARAPPAV